MPYIPTIPQPTDTLADSQPQLLSNFTLINTYIGVDHVAFNAGANQGKHDKVSWMPHPVGTVIPLSVSSMTMMCRNTGTHYNLFYKEHNGTVAGPDTQISNSAVITKNALPGTSFLPGGLMIQWGYVTALAGGGSTNVNFVALGLQDFTAAPFSILTQIRHNGYDADGVGCVTAGATTGFTLKNSSANARDFYWLAIGSK